MAVYKAARYWHKNMDPQQQLIARACDASSTDGVDQCILGTLTVRCATAGHWRQGKGIKVGGWGGLGGSHGGAADSSLIFDQSNFGLTFVLGGWVFGGSGPPRPPPPPPEKRSLIGAGLWAAETRCETNSKAQCPRNAVPAETLRQPFVSPGHRALPDTFWGLLRQRVRLPQVVDTLGTPGELTKLSVLRTVPDKYSCAASLPSQNVLLCTWPARPSSKAKG